MTKQDKNWKSYDGREIEEGQVLVPMLVDDAYARSIGADMGNLRTWTTAGVKYLVMFAPVDLEMEKICWKSFYADLNELLDETLGPARRGRNVVSLDALMEENRLPGEQVSSAESIAMEEILLDELIAAVGKMNPMFGEVVRLGYQGMDRKEIVAALPVKKSQGYHIYINHALLYTDMPGFGNETLLITTARHLLEYRCESEQEVQNRENSINNRQKQEEDERKKQEEEQKKERENDL